jgi:hypothetical protein
MGDVVFRRINGRIIPIRKGGSPKTPAKGIDPQVKTAIVGAGLVAAGVGTALFAGRFASKMVLASARLEDISRAAAKGARVIIEKGRKAATKASSKSLTPWQPDLGFGTDTASEFVFKPAQKELLNKFKRDAFRAGIASNAMFQNRQKVRAFGRIAGGALVTGGLSNLYEGVKGKKPGTAETTANAVAGGIVGASVGLGYYSGLSGFKNAIKNLSKFSRFVK